MNKIKKYRDKLGMTQPELAERSGLSIRTISRIESGIANITQKTGEKLAEALNCTYAELINEEEYPNYLEKASVSMPPQPEVTARVHETRGGGLTLDESSIPLILEYLKCRLERDKKEMNSTDLTFVINKLYDCVRTLDSGRNQSKTA